ncbi:MAG: hypothetical protein RR515_03365 [Clostridium sp.]
MARATVNLRDFEIKGNVLDISSKGSFIIPEMIETYNKQKIEKEFLECEEEIACTASVYNSAIAVLSFNSIMGKKKLEKILLDIKKGLTKDGKFIICDLNVGALTLPSIYTIMLKLPGEKIMKMKYTLGINPFRLKYKHIIDVIQKCGFNIVRKKVDRGVYYIECEKSQEAKNEGNSSIT